MPRVVLTEKQRTREALVGVLAKYQAMYGIDGKVLAQALGMSANTYCRRKRNADEFTLGEIKQNMRSLRIPTDEIIRAVFGVTGSEAHPCKP